MNDVVAECRDLKRQPPRQLRVDQELHAASGVTLLIRLNRAANAYTASKSLALGILVVREDFLLGSAAAQQLQQELDGIAQPANARLAVANFGIDGDSR